MKRFFDPDGPVMQVLTAISNLLVLNLCVLICSIPVVTIGAAKTALYGVLLRREDSGSAISSYIKRFRQNFKQATIVWLIILGIGCFILLDIQFLHSLDVAYPLVEAVLKIGGFLLLAVSSYAFPLLSLYQGKARVTLKNALLLSVAALPKSIVLVLLSVVPAIALILDISFFVQIIFPWLLIGPALTAKLSVFLLKPIFEKFLNNADEESATFVYPSADKE